MQVSGAPSTIRRSRLFTLLGWGVALLGTGVYLATLEPTVSFWDCGEFIATSYTLQVGHPPGAPLYQLLAHCMMLLAGGNVGAMAWCSNALSAVAGGLTAMFLFWTTGRLLSRIRFVRSRPDAGGRTSDFVVFFASFVAAACYLFCDTAWFSAVESEVYSLSMLFSSAIVWAMVRWAQCDDRDRRSRWLLLVALLLGLSVGVHQLSLLTVPALLLVWLLRRHDGVRTAPSVFLCAGFLFLVGLSPYLVVPLRAAADPPINTGNPSSWPSFRAYLARDQYEKAPLLYGRCYNSPVVAYEDGKPVYAKEMDMPFPRMWKHHDHAEEYYGDWAGRHGKMVNVAGREYYKPSFGDNLVFFAGYQLGYMYLRYLMWNFSGRYSDQQGFGNLQKGQFITGIPFVDRLYVGTGRPLPPSLHNAGHNRYFLLPLLLGLVGVFALFRRDKRVAWVVMTLFLMAGVVLSVYLNHPVYEPRERDYAYVLSFYAFAVWIGVGAFALMERVPQWLSRRRDNPKRRRAAGAATALLIVCVPLLMACQNWDDHNRRGRYVARDSAANLLNSCEVDAILFTVGDNDTFPLWYLQQVEGFRFDVQVVNLSLLGSDSYCKSIRRQLHRQGSDLLTGDDWRTVGPYGRMMHIVGDNAGRRPLYFSRYARDAHNDHFHGRLQLCGMAWRLADSAGDSIDCRRSYRLLSSVLAWHPLQGVYIDETSYSFLRQYWTNALQVAERLVDDGDRELAATLLDSVAGQVPVGRLREPWLRYRVAKAYLGAGCPRQHESIVVQVRHDLDEQLDYYGGMSASMRAYIPYTLDPLLRLRSELEADLASCGVSR